MNGGPLGGASRQNSFLNCATAQEQLSRRHKNISQHYDTNRTFVTAWVTVSHTSGPEAQATAWWIYSPGRCRRQLCCCQSRTDTVNPRRDSTKPADGATWIIADSNTPHTPGNPLPPHHHTHSDPTPPCPHTRHAQAPGAMWLLLWSDSTYLLSLEIDRFGIKRSRKCSKMQ
jgi:hypothetical protein